MTTEPAPDANAAELAGVMNAMHAERKSVLQAQLKSIEQQIAQRSLIAAERILAINEDLRTIRTQMLQLTHDDENIPDIDRKDRLTLQDKRLALDEELREEHGSSWRDAQDLEREKREVTRELMFDDQRHARTTQLW